MKTEDEIKSKLQQVEGHILNMAEAAHVSENKDEKEIYETAQDLAIGQAQALKWVLNMERNETNCNSRILP